MKRNPFRYSRQHLFTPIGSSGQDKLLYSRVAIVGMGAIGSSLANHLVRAGVGFIRLIDRDFVDYSNLPGHILYDEKDAEQRLPKALAAKLKLATINSTVQIEAQIADLSWKNAEELLADLDLILDGSDNFEVRYLINDVSVKHHIPWIFGEAVGSKGMTANILPGQTPCLRCLFPIAPKPGTTETSATAGVISPIIQAVASYQAAEALKILVNDYHSLSTALKKIDLWENYYSEIIVEKARNTKCPACVSQKYEHLEPKNGKERYISLCGNDTVQIIPKEETEYDLAKLSKKLAPLGKVEQTPYLLRFYVDTYDLTIFADGRILVHGTAEPVIAKNIYTSYLGE